jgi:branched-subunit amino acid aminotransferase/4-amino-4-deoxychorismate lyase
MTIDTPESLLHQAKSTAVPMKTWKKTGATWQPCESLPLADRGFRYGMSVFETIAIVQGRPLLLEPHLERLQRAAESCGAGVPPALDGSIGGTTHALNFDFSQLETGLLRFYLTAGEGGLEAPFAGKAYAIFDEAQVGWNLPALRVASSAAPYLPRPGGWKTGNYWQNLDALAWARRAGCDEALVFNPAGMLVGATMANVFLRIDGGWRTPVLETGARDGAVRAWVLGALEASGEILDAEALRNCTAAFLTNSRIGIRPIAELDGRPLEVACAEIQRRYFDEIFSC